jgi:Ca-activated chloride channel family protein
MMSLRLKDRSHEAITNRIRVQRSFAMSRNRRGTITILVAALMIGFVAMVAISIDMAYLHMSRTELRAATDAAAKAASVTLSQTQDINAARNSGIQVAGLNTIGGKPLVLNNNNFIFGNSSRNQNGKFSFTPGKTPFNGVRVIAELGQGSASGGVDLFFGNLHGVKVFETRQEAISTYLERDIVVVIDRSGSMQGQKYRDLCDALSIFVATVQETPTKEFMGLASYSSGASVDLGYTLDLGLVPGKAKGLKVDGMTSISAGIDAGYQIIQTGRSKLFVERTMVVMTDGQHNTGREPIIPARVVAADGVTIHTITFGAGADKSRMAAIAAVGRGRHLHADNGAQLKAAFRDIALTLSTMLTQ